MGMKLTILGCGSAIPRINSSPTSQVLEVNGSLFLIDCGENTQVKLRMYGLKLNSIDNIFISHLHGDHFFGLIGLISTYHLLGRNKPFKIYSPKGLKEIIEIQLKISGFPLCYKLIFFEIENTKESKKIYENKKIEIFTIPLKHRIPTIGYLFREKKKDRIMDKNMILKYNIPLDKMNGIKKGDDFITKEEDIIPNKEITLSPEAEKSYAFCSDTIYKRDIIPIVSNVDILYHESTFLEEHADLAKKTFHSTAKQAGTIAKEAKVKKLILGHFSQRYKNKEKFLEEAKEIFKDTELAQDGKGFTF